MYNPTGGLPQWKNIINNKLRRFCVMAAWKVLLTDGLEENGKAIFQAAAEKWQSDFSGCC